MSFLCLNVFTKCRVAANSFGRASRSLSVSCIVCLGWTCVWECAEVERVFLLEHKASGKASAFSTREIFVVTEETPTYEPIVRKRTHAFF